MVRSVLAVAAGFFATAVLSLAADLVFRAVAPQAFGGGARSSGVLLAILAYTGIFGATGGYITARIAIQRPLAHALALGVIALLVNGAVAVAARGTVPVWYQVATLLIIIPAALLGGALRARSTKTDQP